MSTPLHTVTLTADSKVVRAYGELTNDFNPIHLDAEFAEKTSMGRCIAHGTMSICLLWKSLFRSLDAATARRMELDIRFVKPVWVGETIHAGGEGMADEPGSYAVWVRGEDGVDRVTGVARAVPAKEEA